MSEPLGEKQEEILERLWIANFENSRAAVTADELGVEDAEEAAAELERLGFISRSEGRLSMRDAGLEEARTMVRRHRLAERLFIDVLDVKGELSEESACRFEHLLHHGIEEKICTLLGHPRVCPHGKPIPPGRCCEEARKNPEKVVASLADLLPGQAGTIAYVHSADPRKVSKLLAMGILPGAPVLLIGRAPSFSFRVGYSQFAVDEQLAGDIYVRMDAARSDEGSRTRPRVRARDAGKGGVPHG
jgi:DtxR family Mn-dependent transcriptional regulator